MARVRAEDIDKVVSSGGRYLTLKDDGDQAAVRFLYDSFDEIEYDVVHQVDVDGQDKYVDCLRLPGDPADVCPFCLDKNLRAQGKLFLQVVELNQDREPAENVTIWDRGKGYFSKLESTFRRVQGPIVSTVFEIERNGARGDTQTKYELFACESDEAVTLDTLPEKLDLREEGIILEKTAEEMDFYIENGYFEGETTEQPRSRAGNARSSARPAQRNSAPSRRAPAGRNEAPAREQAQPATRSRRNVDRTQRF